MTPKRASSSQSGLFFSRPSGPGFERWRRPLGLRRRQRLDRPGPLVLRPWARRAAAWSGGARFTAGQSLPGRLLRRWRPGTRRRGGRRRLADASRRQAVCVLVRAGWPFYHGGGLGCVRGTVGHGGVNAGHGRGRPGQPGRASLPAILSLHSPVWDGNDTVAAGRRSRLLLPERAACTASPASRRGCCLFAKHGYFN